MSNLTRRISVRMSEQEVEALERMAAQLRRSVSDVLRIIVDAQLGISAYNKTHAELNITETGDSSTFLVSKRHN